MKNAGTLYVSNMSSVSLSLFCFVFHYTQNTVIPSCKRINHHVSVALEHIHTLVPLLPPFSLSLPPSFPIPSFLHSSPSLSLSLPQLLPLPSLLPSSSIPSLFSLPSLFLSPNSSLFPPREEEEERDRGAGKEGGGSYLWIINEPHLPEKRPRCHVKSPTAQDAFQPIPGLINCTEVTGRWGLQRCIAC